MKILTVPEEKGLIRVDDKEALINEFAELFSEQAEQLASRYGIKVTKDDFFGTMTSDPDYIKAEGKLAETVKNNLKENLRHG